MADISVAAVYHDLHAVAAAALIGVAEKFDVAAGNGGHCDSPMAFPDFSLTWLLRHYSCGTVFLRHYCCDTIAPALNSGAGSKRGLMKAGLGAGAAGLLLRQTGLQVLAQAP